MHFDFGTDGKNILTEILQKQTQQAARDYDNSFIFPLHTWNKLHLMQTHLQVWRSGSNYYWRRLHEYITVK